MSKRNSMLAVTAILAIAACGDNLWSDLPTGWAGSATGAPSVEISSPSRGQRISVGDSVLIVVRVHDTDPISSLHLSGIAVQGDAELGTDKEIVRYHAKTLSFGQAEVSDTTIRRFLLATADSLPEEKVFIIASARDVSGNMAADTVVIGIGEGA